MRFPPIRSAVVVLAVTSAVAGCGSSSSSSASQSGGGDNGVSAKAPDAALQAAATATTTARSVHIFGSLVSGGTPISLDMHLASGAGGRGQMSENGLSFQLISAGKSVYIKGSPSFWQHFGGAAAVQLLQGKWLKAPTTDANFGSLSSLTDFHQFFNSVLKSHGTLTKGATTTVDGQKVVPLNDGAQGTLYVAATGPPYPVEIAKRGSGGGRLRFADWNAPVALAPPANAIDVNQLKAH